MGPIDLLMWAWAEIPVGAQWGLVAAMGMWGMLVVIDRLTGARKG